MRGPLTLALALALGPAAPAAAARPLDGPTSDDEAPSPTVAGALWSENLRDYAERRLAEGDLAGAADFYLRAYDRLAWDARARELVVAAHAPLERAVNTAADAQRLEPHRTELLCEADRRVIRHAVLLGDIDRLTPEAIAVLRTARGRLQGRLIAAGAVCPRPVVTGPPSIQVLAADAYHGDRDGPILDPGALVTAAATPPVAVASFTRPRLERARAYTRAGVGLIAAGMMTLGVGIIMVAQEREASAALTFVAGTAGLVSGFPLLIVGDRYRRANVALGPRGLALNF